MRKSKWIRILASIGILFLIVFVVIPPFTRRWYRNHSLKYAPPVPANSWKVFSSDEGKFSVLFPGLPKTTNILSSFSTENVESHVFYVNANVQNSFAVSYEDSPVFAKMAKLQNPQQFLEKAQAITVLNEFGKVVYQREMEFGDYPVREFEYAAGGKANYSARIREILVGERIYQIYVVFLTANPHTEDRDIFFNSLRLHH